MPIGSVRRVIRQVRRIAIAVLLSCLAVVAAALVFLHTAIGRELVREELELQLSGEFTGGAHVGAYEGSPFTTITLRDVAIYAPDHRTVAIRVGALHAGVALWPLVDKTVRVTELTVEDVDVRVGDDFGRLVKPSPEPSSGPSAWTVEVPALSVAGGHVALVAQDLDLDGIGLGGAVRIAGGATRGSLALGATWRQRAHAPVVVVAHAGDDGTVVQAPSLFAQVGGVLVAGRAVRFERGFDPATAPIAPGPDPVATSPRVAGELAVIAPRAAVRALVPQVDLPDDIAARAEAAPDGAREAIALDGALGVTPVALRARADLLGRAIAGQLHTGELDLAALTRGAQRGVAAIARARFAATLPPAGSTALPDAELHAIGHAAVSGAPNGVFAIEAKTGGIRASLGASVLAGAGAQAVIAASATKDGDRIVLERASVIAAAHDLTAQVRGDLAVALAAHGPLAPAPDVRVTGLVTGKAVRTDSLALGTLRVDLDAQRTGTLSRGTVALAAHGLALDPRAPVANLTARISAAPGRATVDVSGELAGLGTAKTANPRDVGTAAKVGLALDVAAPQRLEDAAAWRAKGPDAVRALRLQVQNVEIARVLSLLQPDKSKHATRFDLPPGAPQVSGRIDGDLQLTATTASGKLTIADLKSPAMRGIRSAHVELDLARPAPRQLAPTLVVDVADVGKATVAAQLALPARPFDPAAWQRAGLAALTGATVETTPIAVDPAFWDRLQIESTLRGKLALQARVGAALADADVTFTGTDVRGTPLAEPVGIALRLGAAGKELTGALAMTTKRGATTLLHVDAKIPIALAELRTRGLGPALQLAGARPLTATVELPKTDAKQLMNVFGHTEVTRGVLDGKVVVAGTLAHPTVGAHLTADGIGVPPGPHGKPIQILDHLAVDATYAADGKANVKLAGRENAGGILAATITADARQPLAGRARLVAKKFDLGPLLAFAPGPAGGSRGTLEADLAIAGFDVRTSHITGQVHLTDARVPIAPTVGTLRQAKIDIAISDQQIALTTDGKLGPGTVKVDGTIALDKGVELTGGAVTIALRHVSPIGAVEPFVDADITAKLARKAGQWRANVVVDHGFVKITGKQGEAIKPDADPKDLRISKGGKLPPRANTQPGNAPPPPKQPSLVADIVLKTTRVESEEVRTTLEGKLTVTADADAVGVVGQIAANAGELMLFDRRYHVERAGVRFDGTVDPLVDVQITHDFEDVTTVTQVRGRLSKPELVLSSTPGSYSQSELLGFLLGGEPGGDPNAGGARDKLTNAGESFIAGQLGNYVKRALPFDIDVIKYEAAGVDSSAAITVGSWLTHSLFFAFRQHLDARPDENTGEGTIEYFLTKRIEVQGTAGDRNYDAIDFLWRRRF